MYFEGCCCCFVFECLFLRVDIDGDVVCFGCFGEVLVDGGSFVCVIGYVGDE